MRYLPPSSDIIFKALFGDHKHSEFILGFLKSFLECPNDEFVGVEFVDPLLSKQNQTGKYNYLYLLLRTRSGHKINVKMQNSDLPGLEKRVAYYLSRLCSTQLNEAEDYSLLNRTIVIFILNYKMKPERFNNSFVYFDDCLSNWRLRNKKGEDLISSLEVDIIELPKVPKKYKSNLFFDWLTFIKSRKEEEFKMIENNTEYPEVKQAVARLAQLSSDEATQILYDYQLKKIMDERVLQREAIEKGMRKGKIEGMREGIKKGIRQGKLEGKIEGKIEGVVKLITKYGINIDEAMKDLELPAEYKEKVLAKLGNNPD